MSEPAVLEPQALERLRRVGGSGLLAQMLALFAEHAPARVAAARTGMAAGDLAAVARAAHALISSAGNVGAAQLMASAATLEAAALTQRHADAEAAMQRLEEAFARLARPLEDARREAAT